MNIAELPPTKDYVTTYSIAPDIIGYKNIFVNYYFIGHVGQGNSGWLVDAGLPGSSREIIRKAENLFGRNNPPEGVVLTHGHFDHVGRLRGLIRKWPDIKIYAHPLEMPFITGESSYPPPDPSVPGAMARMSWLYPMESAHIEHHVYPLEGGEIPGLSGWRYIETPGHSPGHISLFREDDKRLLAGDAFVTTNQNEAYSTMMQRKEIHAAPAYLTIHWGDTKQSIRKLMELEAEAVGTGHGLPYFGEELREDLQSLLDRFEIEEVPENGHYVKHPVNYSDIQYESFEKPESYRRAVNMGRTAAVTALTIGASLLWMRRRKRRNGAGSANGASEEWSEMMQEQQTDQDHSSEKRGWFRRESSKRKSRSGRSSEDQQSDYSLEESRLIAKVDRIADVLRDEMRHRIREVSGSGRRRRGWMGRRRTTGRGGEIKDRKTRDRMEQGAHQAIHQGEQMAESAMDYGEDAGKRIEKGTRRAIKRTEKLSDRAIDTAGKMSDRLVEGSQKARHGLANLAEKAVDRAGQLGESLERGARRAIESGEKLTEKTIDSAGKLSDRMEEGAHKATHTAADLAGKAVDQGGRLRKRAGKMGRKAKEQASEMAHQSVERGREKGEHLSRRARRSSQSADGGSGFFGMFRS